jgi:type IV pilus assembly protein PilO
MKSDRQLTWSERLRSPMLWHWTGITVLSLLVLVLVVRLVYAWAVTDSSATRTLESKKSQLEALQQDTTPLRGLDKRVVATRNRIGTFYEERIPASYSLLATRIAELQTRSGVQLSHISYTQGAPGVDLTEISMDASISGEYPQIMRFVNGLERDQIFFVIRALSLNGQQGGQANLRLRVSTWLRAADAAASGLPMTKPAGQEDTPTAPIAAATGREGN